MTATAEALKCKWCKRPGTLNGRLFTSEQGLHLHEALCVENPHRKIRPPRGQKAKTGKALAKRNGHALEPSNPEMPADVINLDFPLGYITGRTSAQIENFAGRLGLPPAIITARVARLLQREARGEVLGTHHRMP